MFEPLRSETFAADALREELRAVQPDLCHLNELIRIYREGSLFDGTSDSGNATRRTICVGSSRHRRVLCVCEEELEKAMDRCALALGAWLRQCYDEHRESEILQSIVREGRVELAAIQFVLPVVQRDLFAGKLVCREQRRHSDTERPRSMVSVAFSVSGTPLGTHFYETYDDAVPHSTADVPAFAFRAETLHAGPRVEVDVDPDADAGHSPRRIHSVDRAFFLLTRPNLGHEEFFDLMREQGIVASKRGVPIDVG
jgi:hypothetical protein